MELTPTPPPRAGEIADQPRGWWSEIGRWYPERNSNATHRTPLDARHHRLIRELLRDLRGQGLSRQDAEQEIARQAGACAAHRARLRKRRTDNMQRHLDRDPAYLAWLQLANDNRIQIQRFKLRFKREQRRPAGMGDVLEFAEGLDLAQLIVREV